MNTLNNFICFEPQTVSVTSETTVLEIGTQFLEVVSATEGAKIDGFDLKVSGECIMLMVVNTTDKAITLTNQAVGVPTNQQFHISTGANKVIPPYSFEVIIFCSNKLMVRDIALPIT